MAKWPYPAWPPRWPDPRWPYWDLNLCGESGPLPECGLWQWSQVFHEDFCRHLSGAKVHNGVGLTHGGASLGPAHIHNSMDALFQTLTILTHYLQNTCILNNSSKCGKGLILYMLYIWGKDEADSYRWTTVDAFSSKEKLLSMDHNSRVPGRHQNTNKPNPMKVVNYS